MAVPKFNELYNPLLQALHDLGGSASVQEMDEKVADILKLTDKEIAEIHKGSRTKLSYNMGWARNYLKRYGILENSARAIWSLTLSGNKTKTVDKNEVDKKLKNLEIEHNDEHDNIIKKEEIDEWKDTLLTILKKLSPSDFEKLCQRVLREAGFIQVIITGRSGDGGIDGRGIVKIGGFLNFRVIFQCKRYQGSISPRLIREFKGAMDGRADKGLFITTGTFTRDAKQEANRDGSIPIDLISLRVNSPQLAAKPVDCICEYLYS